MRETVYGGGFEPLQPPVLLSRCFCLLFIYLISSQSSSFFRCPITSALHHFPSWSPSPASPPPSPSFARRSISKASLLVDVYSRTIPKCRQERHSPLSGVWAPSSWACRKTLSAHPSCHGSPSAEALQPGVRAGSSRASLSRPGVLKHHTPAGRRGKTQPLASSLLFLGVQDSVRTAPLSQCRRFHLDKEGVTPRGPTRSHVPCRSSLSPRHAPCHPVLELNSDANVQAWGHGKSSPNV